MKTNDFEEKEENFADLFENSIAEIDSFEPGQQVETEIVSISGNTIFLQLSGKSEGVMDIEEMMDKDGNVTVQEGETIKVYFLNAENGEMHFTTRISGEKAGKAVLENAFENGIPVEGVVEKEIKGGFEIKIGDSRAFCPYSQIGLKRVENAAEYIGQHLTFKIIEHSERGRNILVSSRAILEDEHKKQIEVLKETLKKGAAVKGTVKSLRDFGAFVDIDGIQALLPISEISRSRVDDIKTVLSVGQEIEAVILNLDWQNERISVSMKSLEADPWDKAKANYPEGSKHTGTIVRITEFGAFVSLEPGLDGLIHVSELKGDDPREDNPQYTLKKGDSIDIQINSVDEETKRISLRPASRAKEEESFKKYMESDTETYNPFAALLKDRMDKK